MANGAQTASTYSSGAGFWTNMIMSIGELFNPNPMPALPTRPNPGSQVLIAQAAGRIVDPGSPKGYAVADLWYDPISSQPGTPQSIVGYETVVINDPYGATDQFGRVRTTSYQKPIYGPRMYMVKSAVQEDSGYPKVAESVLFRSPEAAPIALSPCQTPTSEVAATANERLNRLTLNQFLSPFRARRAGGNSYQALSDPVDNIFNPGTGRPGDFSQEMFPAFLQSGKSLRLPRGR